MNTRVVSPGGTRPATPQQLTWLGTQLDAWCDEGLLDREQRGRNVWYSIAEDRREAIADLLR